MSGLLLEVPGVIVRTNCGAHSKEGGVMTIAKALTKRGHIKLGDAGFVYLVNGGDLFKVGWSMNPERRLRQLQAYSPAPLTLMCSLPADVSYERRIHSCIEKDRAHGEWFRWNEETETLAACAMLSKACLDDYLATFAVGHDMTWERLSAHFWPLGRDETGQHGGDAAGSVSETTRGRLSCTT